MYLQRVKNESVWQSLKILFMGSLLIFLINIYFGFDNSLTAGEIERWQVLIHLHGGSIGWITLSAIGIMIWLVSGDRNVDTNYERRVRTLVWAAVLIFAGYVPSFGLAFSRPSGFLVALLPIFGSGAVIVLWVSAIFAFSQFKHQPVVTSVHFLAAGALLTAAIGATVGMLLGLERVIGQFLPLPAGDRVGAHAGMMDTYLFLVASGVVEWATRKEATRWSWAGLLQALFWMVGAALVPIAFFLNMVEQILPIFMLMLLVGLLFFLIRFAWRALANFSLSPGTKSWTFFGTLWLIIYMGLFLYGISLFMSGGGFEDVSWFAAVFAHSGFVGMMTNLIMGVIASRAQDGREVLPWGESASFWLINLGMLTFFVLKISSDIRLGAIVMGLGVLLGVFTMFRRLQAS
ncbi:MAG: hypothetical protein JSV61_06685 [Anaerolineales bacterium]|nr:MAG: hypothetical protein JSV61_06685 [Anaerolineales bacterium]